MAAPLRVFQPDGQQQPATETCSHVRNVIDLYSENLYARNRADDYSDDSLDGALRALRRFAGDFGHLELVSCRQHDLTRFFGLNPKWKASGTKKRVASTILAGFRWAAEEQLIDRCPYTWPKILKGLADKVRRPADPKEYVELMRFGSRPLRRALFFLRRTGVRPKEMRDLVWPEVDLGTSPHINDRRPPRISSGPGDGFSFTPASASAAGQGWPVSVTAAAPRTAAGPGPARPGARDTYLRALRGAPV